MIRGSNSYPVMTRKYCALSGPLMDWAFLISLRCLSGKWPKSSISAGVLTREECYARSLTLNQLESLLSPELVTHVGDDFPETCDAAITLIEVSREEGTATWAAGYSHVNASPTDFDERLRFLPEPISYETPRGQVRRSDE
jgi:hypothetical protein